MTRWIPALLAAAWLVAGCGSSSYTPCTENLNCDITEFCQAGRCVVRSCQSSADCPIQHFCNDTIGACVPGCQLDRDCLPNEVCDDGTCEVAGCRDTNLDCPVGDFCNSITGECFPAGGFYCQPCSGAGAEECGGTRNFCVNIGGSGPYCGVDCSTGQECPRGYDCVPIVDAGRNIIGRNCIAPCWLLE
jgi:hypothetical protein